MSRVGTVYKPRRKRHVCVCKACKQTFQSSRFDAKTCSPRCRKRLQRGTEISERNGGERRKLVINSAQGRLWIEV